MIAYLDSSVVLRFVLGQPKQLAEWDQIVTAVSSTLLEVECLRTIDRLRLRGYLSVEQAVERREVVFQLLEALQLVEMSSPVLHRAAQQFASPLGTLDAVHLATADLWRETHQKDLIMATHDRELALAARATGLRVIGV